MAIEVTNDRVWLQHAGTWDLVRPPLRPSIRDVRLFEAWARAWVEGKKMPRVVLLGVTPELMLMRWPEDTRIVAVEQNPAMLEVYNRHAMFAPETLHVRSVISSWASMDTVLGDEPFDLVIGDGCYTQLEKLEYEFLGDAVRSILKPDGAFLHRFFLKPSSPLSQDTRKSVLDMRSVPFAAGGFSAFKLRLLMALQRSFSEGVVLDDVWEAWEAWLEGKRIVDVAPQHWTDQEVATLRHYRKSNAKYTFPTSDELEGALAPLKIKELIRMDRDICPGWDYELADRCVIAELRP